KLASKHPTQTTIVQMQKDGTYRVVYGSSLRGITGRVKMVVVGYGREEGDTQTLGGRTADELSANITKLNQGLNPVTTTIGRTSLVGCNLESDNPTDNADSQYGKQVLQKLHQRGIGVDLSVRSSYVGIQPDGTKVTSDTGVDNWKHKDNKNKTIYSYGKDDKIESKVYDSKGVLVKYNGQYLDGTRYKSNVIVQNSNNSTVVEAANALFNKHPDTSIIVKFDQNGNLVTLKGETYTPTGDIRVNFVDHGADLTQEGAQSLVDKAKILQQTYGNDSTRIKRIALVGCDTDGVSQGLTRDFAYIAYNDIPALQHTEITGRTGQVQVNDDGTKTMTTDGTKTIYSWDEDKGDITQKTETVKRYSDVLENPLNELDDQIKEIEKLLESEKFKSSEQSEHRDILVNTLEVLHELQRNGLEFFLDKLDPVRSDFHAHLEKNPSSVVSKELNRIYSSLEKYVSNIEMHSKLQLSLYEQYEEAQSLEVGKKIEVLKEVLDQFLELSRGNSEISEWAEHYRLVTEWDIQVAKESQTKLEKWRQPTVFMDSTDPFVGYKHQVIVTITDDQSQILLKNEQHLASKYPHNTTIVHMEKDGNYQVVFGLELDEVPKGDLKVMINGHGDFNKIGDRSIEEIAEHIGTINQAVGDDSEIKKVSLVACYVGSEYPKMLLPKLQEEGINSAKVSTRLGVVTTWPNGRKTVKQTTGSFSQKYHSNILKETYALDEKGDIVLVDSYTDEHYDLVLSANEDGTPKIERIYGNKLIDELQGGLKIHVKAADFNEAKELLHQFEEKLPPDASMEHINIKTQKDDDWFDQHDALKLGKSLDNLGEYFDASILLYPDPDKGQVTMATRDKDSTMMILKDDSRFLIESDFSKNILRLTEYENPRQRIWGYGSNDFDSDIQVIIEHRRIEDIPTIEATLENLKSISEITQQSVSNIVIEAPKGIDLNHYKELVVALSNKYKVEVEVSMKLEDGSTKRLLSKKPGKLIKHLAQATSYQNKLLQNWDILSQEQTTKLTEESQKTKPS
ncbi:hypothetical protein BROOK1789C_1001, partial [Bathymodiolus brooksi thiotrophic gill symbiont]